MARHPGFGFPAVDVPSPTRVLTVDASRSRPRFRFPAAIMNKKTLSVFPYPWVLSWVQIAVGAVFMCIMWKLRLFKPPEGGFTKEMFKALIPTSALHLIAHVSACASYKLGSVSFMQVVKAGEPACSVILLSLFFGRKYSKLVWLTLIPIVGGVAVGSTSELNFSMAAFLCAMTSNIASALRGVTSKDLQETTGLSGINLYGGIAIVSGIMQLPMSLIAEGAQMPAALAAAPALMAEKGITLFGLQAGFLAYLVTGSMFYHLYNQTSYQALGELSPLSHSVANTVKRVVIILASVAVFKNPITPLGQASAAVAIAGTFLYTLASNTQKKDAALAAAAEAKEA
jgi:solute carrier family 35 protein E1